MTTPYDDIPYPSAPRVQTHPLRLSALAHLLGLPHAPFSGCRVLEIGCGDGMNLIAMALTAPDARFVGLDLAQTAIARGQAFVDSLGLDNVRLLAMDICDAGDLGAFDYVIAHGVYAWTPEPVREGLMALMGRSLSPHGLAMVSYNALPGCRIRQILRDLLKDAVVQGEAAADRLARVVARLDVFMTAWKDDDPYQLALKSEAAMMLARPRAVMFHDELGEVYAPQFLTDVVAHGVRHGLDYLCDLNMVQAVEVDPALAALADGDLVRLEHLQDFAVMRRFRQSVFRRAGGPAADARVAPERLNALHALSSLRRVSGPDADGVHRFATDKLNSVEVSDDRLAALIDAIIEAAPGALPLAGHDVERLAPAVLQLMVTGMIHLQTGPFALLRTAGPRPTASPLARLQIAREEATLSALNHTNVRVEDPAARRFIALLDGSRDRAALARDMGAPEAQIDQALGQLAGLGLIQA